MASPPGYGYSASAFPPLQSSAPALSPDAFPTLNASLPHGASTGGVNGPGGLGLAASGVDLAALPARQRAYLIAREQHRASLLGSVNNGTSSPNAAALLSTLNGRQTPLNDATKGAAASLPPGLVPAHPVLNGTPPRSDAAATVDVSAARAAIEAAHSSLSSFASSGGTMRPGSETPTAVETAVDLAQNALDTAASTQGSTDNVVVSGPGASALLSLMSESRPEPPAQQVLLSPADRFGLLGLLAMIKSSDETSLLSMGTDLSRMGMNLNSREPLSTSFVTPWSADAVSQASTPALAQAQVQVQTMVEPEYHLPSCYNVQPPPPAQSKITHLADETLFFIFYSAPRDVLQETSARELYQRGWRHHKTLRMWLTKEPSSEPIQKTAQYERGTYVFFDPGPWEKVTKVFTLYYEALEERAAPGAALSTPASSSLLPHVHAHAPVLSHSHSPLVQVAASQQQQQHQQHHPLNHGLMGQYPSQAALAQQIGQMGLARSQAVQHALAQQRRAASQGSQAQGQAQAS